MSWSDPDTTLNPSNGAAITAAWGDVVNADMKVLWDGLAQPWAPYDAGLTLVNSAGDLEREGYTHRIAYHINAQFAYRMGSTTTYTAGTVEFDLPFTSGVTGPHVIGDWVGYDSSTGDYTVGLVIVKAASTTLGQLVHDDPTSNGGLVSNTVPFTWASGDELSASFCYPSSTAPTGLLV